MAIDFPNQSRSYDARRHGVRFWGHDDALEVSFLIEEGALTHLDRTTPQTEAGFLAAFDGNRDRIFEAANKAYSPRGSGFYALAATDFR
jgi:hypothetical protein